MRRGKLPDGLECRGRDKWGVVDKEGLAWKCPIGIKEHIGWKTLGNGEVRLGHTGTPTSMEEN